MERVAFLIEATNEVLRCMLNPETLVMQRTAGVRPLHSLNGPVTGAGLTDDPVVFTGGGRTLLELELLFDLSLSDSTNQVADVRALTLPLWQMAENTRQGPIYSQPPQVLFIWGKSWSIPAVVLSVAERYERFTIYGQAQRSWMSLRLLRINSPNPQPQTRQSFFLSSVPAPADLGNPDETWGTHEVIEGERIDQIADKYYGDSSLWRLLAAVNEVDDPGNLGLGQILHVPPRRGGGAS